MEVVNNTLWMKVGMIEVAGQRKSHDMMTIRIILVDCTKGVATSRVYLCMYDWRVKPSLPAD